MQLFHKIPILFAAFLAMSPAPGLGDEAPFNLPAPTLGGKQFWTDVFFQSGWRIQRNVWTGHHRLLDPDDWRQAWGSFEECRAAFTDIMPQTGADEPTHLVILVHGILRSGDSFGALPERLVAAGYAVAPISYASTRRRIADHAADLEALMDRLTGVARVSFVTHSMGGLVVRQMLSQDGAWQSRIAVDSVVMVAPPSHGSQVAAMMRDQAFYQLIYGEAGQELPNDVAEAVPTLAVPFGVIAGGLGDGEGFNPLVPGDDDGVVSVDEAHLAGEKDFLLIPALHSLILRRPETANAVLTFLKHGRFTDPVHDGDQTTLVGTKG